MKKVAFLFLGLWVYNCAWCYWQQKVEYTMEIDMDTENHQFDGYQKLVYHNNSPDALEHVFYHLYFNAFQPGSMMDVRSRNIEDPDGRIGNRIAKLSESQIGFHKIKWIKQDGAKLKFEVNGTVLKAQLNKPIAAGSTSVLEMEFHSQIPLQIRRSGRQNFEGIDYSMAQWYPKMAEYDEDGWHPDPYVFREFYGVWGDFDVKISIDPSYVIGATGYLQNPSEIGHGYTDRPVQQRISNGKLTWHFKAPNVHDFVWAADPDYTHIKYQVPDGPMLHFFYQAKDSLTSYWKDFPLLASKGFIYLSEHFGKYPYKQYSIIQGGDGGMEYPMATLITGRRKKFSLFGVTMHEAAHSWYQMLLGSNESQYPWMDEGFTNYAGNEAFTRVTSSNPDRNPHLGSFDSYYDIVESGIEEPLTTHADHFNTNRAYGTASYAKGELFLVQLKYIVGPEAFDKGMKQYFKEWSYKHPKPSDFIRVMERQSGMVLDWYLQYWIGTTKTIDYGVFEVKGDKKETIITLERVGAMPMPVVVEITFEDGETKEIYIPLGLMNGRRTDFAEKEVRAPWAWTHPYYEFVVKESVMKVSEVKLKFDGVVADVNAQNDRVELNHDYDFYYRRN